MSVICCKCKVEKDESEFAASMLKRGHRCKSCVKEYQKQHRAKPEVKERAKEYWKQYCADPEIKERIKEYDKQRRADPGNKECKREYDKQRRADPEVKDREKEQQKQHRANPEVKGRKKEYHKQYYAKPEIRRREKAYHKQYQKQRCATDPLFKTACDLRSLIGVSLRGRGYTKRSKSTQLLGADFKTVQHHLGPVPTYEYHVDHICPIAQAQNEEEAYKLNHYTNLRYLSKEENLQKSDKKTLEGEEMCRQLLNREWIDGE